MVTSRAKLNLIKFSFFLFALLAINKRNFLYVFIELATTISPVLSSQHHVLLSLYSLSINLVTVLIFISNLFFLYIRRRELNLLASQKSVQCLIIFALMALLFSSTVWSINPSETVKQCLNFTNSTLLGLNIAIHFRLKEQINLIALACAAFIIFSFALIFLVPSIGIMGPSIEAMDMGEIINEQDIYHLGAWAGNFGHKNRLGTFMAFSTMVYYFCAQVNPQRYRWLSWLGLGLSFCLVIGSTSRNGFLGLGVVVPLLLIIKLFSRLNLTSKQIRWLISGLILMTLLSIATLIPDILSLVGRDMTFSGRTEIWHAVWVEIQQRPLHGFGHGAFWPSFCNSPGPCPSLELYWNPYTAHNGFIDVILSVGFPGLFLLVASVFWVAFREFECLIKNENFEIIFAISFLLFWISINLFESLLLRSMFFWCIYMATSLSFCLKEPLLPSSQLDFYLKDSITDKATADEKNNL